jgi:hypothetical protein
VKVFRARNGAALARTPVLPEANRVGALSARSTRSLSVPFWKECATLALPGLVDRRIVGSNPVARPVRRAISCPA